jgi:hypothetical protein
MDSLLDTQIRHRLSSRTRSSLIELYLVFSVSNISVMATCLRVAANSWTLNAKARARAAMLQQMAVSYLDIVQSKKVSVAILLAS